MIFSVFLLNFSLHDSLENAVFEHLEWLKFPNFFWGSAHKPLQEREAYNPLPTAVLNPGALKLKI